jgi:hypothetical protein
MMSEIISPNSGLFFMKVGLHAGEAFEQILERKRMEYQKTGMIFWGYGGGTCHPTRIVQPFAKMKIEEGDNIYLVMEEIISHNPPTVLVAREYSEDGIRWKPIPSGIIVRGSRYAVVLNELRDGDLDLNLSMYQVAVGPSMGKPAGDYIGGRVDKACLTNIRQDQPSSEPQIKKIHHFAEVKSPYAVFTR